MPVDRTQVIEALKVTSYVVKIIAGIVQVKYYLLGDPPSQTPKRELLGGLINIREGLKAMRRALTRFDSEGFVKHYNKVKGGLDKLVPDIEIKLLHLETVESIFETMRKEFERTRMRPVGYYIIRAFITASLYPLLAQIIKSIRLEGL